VLYMHHSWVLTSIRSCIRSTVSADWDGISADIQGEKYQERRRELAESWAVGCENLVGVTFPDEVFLKTKLNKESGVGQP
jgi:hypothetical protein